MEENSRLTKEKGSFLEWVGEIWEGLAQRMDHVFLNIRRQGERLLSNLVTEKATLHVEILKDVRLQSSKSLAASDERKKILLERRHQSEVKDGILTGLCVFVSFSLIFFLWKTRPPQPPDDHCAVHVASMSAAATVAAAAFAVAKGQGRIFGC